ncbi:thermonuclease family protein, partial [Mycobacteroides abscessus]
MADWDNRGYERDRAEGQVARGAGFGDRRGASGCGDAVGVCAFASTAAGCCAECTVVRDVDGDTIDVRHDQRGRLRVRIVGLDTPETHRPGVGVGCGGPEASAFAKQTLEGQRVA